MCHAITLERSSFRKIAPLIALKPLVSFIGYLIAFSSGISVDTQTDRHTDRLTDKHTQHR